MGPVVTQGSRRNKALSSRKIHCRGIHRPHDVLNKWHLCSNAPTEWKCVEQACDDCLMSNAASIPSDAHSPKVEAPGDLVSFDVMKMGVKHVHGGQSAVLGVHDHYSKYNWVKLLKNETEEEIICAMRDYRNLCIAHKVVLRHVHTDNFQI